MFGVVVAGHLQHIHRHLGKQYPGKLIGGIDDYIFLNIPLLRTNFQQQIAQLVRPEPFQIRAFSDVVGKHRVNPFNLFLFRFFVQHFRGYQRKYVWEEKQWRELLDDLKYCLENENISSVQDWTHFLGSFVFEKNQKDNKLVVIDGQQRLTTIIIMLCAICVLFNEAGEQDRFNGVTKYILGTDDLGKPYSRVGNADLSNFQLLVDEATSYNSLQSKSSLFSGTYLVSTPKDNLNIKQCFNFFYTQFSEMIDSAEQRIIELSRIKDKILALDVIEILATNQQESYNIFEILNARGVDLQQHELIKNYILKYVQPRSDIDRAKIQWDKLEDLLFVDKRPVITTFFNHYVTHRYEKPTKDNSEFRIIKAKCSKNEMSELLEDLIQKAKIYRWFYLPGECNNAVIRQALQFFKDNNHRQFRPIFLSVISALNQEKIDITMAEKFFILPEFCKPCLFVFAKLLLCLRGNLWRQIKRTG